MPCAASFLTTEDRLPQLTRVASHSSILAQIRREEKVRAWRDREKAQTFEKERLNARREARRYRDYMVDYELGRCGDTKIRHDHGAGTFVDTPTSFLKRHEPPTLVGSSRGWQLMERQEQTLRGHDAT